MRKDNVFSMELKGSQKFTRLFGDSSKPKGLRSGFVVLKPKESVGLHNTGPSEEVIFIITGTAVIHYGTRKRSNVKKNAFIYIPPQTPHNISNSGSKWLKYIYIAAKV
ncbi:MAG: cupin domain-containing protein [Candidatus Omnitrophota bacterium]|nr:cupin domain-containing protein [Candidatus Omnitrophota bacterium]